MAQCRKNKTHYFVLVTEKNRKKKEDKPSNNEMPSLKDYKSKQE